MGRRQRIDRFGGSKDEYIKFLEQRVLDLKAQVRNICQCQQATHQHTATFHSQLSTQPSTQTSIQPPTQTSIQPPTQTSIQPSTQLSREFTFQYETPSQAVKATKPFSEEWKTLTRNFARAVPKNEKEWVARREEVHLHRPETVIRTFCLLTRRSQQLSSLDIGDAPGRETSILNVLRDYQVFTSVLRTERDYAKQVSYYSTLLFVGLSKVALWTGANLDEVDDHMRKFLTDQQGKECKATMTYLGQLRTAATWPIRRMDELYDKGLKHRSWEIFVLCMVPSSVLANHC